MFYLGVCVCIGVLWLLFFVGLGVLLFENGGRERERVSLKVDGVVRGVYIRGELMSFYARRERKGESKI